MSTRSTEIHSSRPVRFRVLTRLWRKPLLVVQVQEDIQTSGDSRDPLDFGQSVTVWRDAKVEDFLIRGTL